MNLMMHQSDIGCQEVVAQLYVWIDALSTSPCESLIIVTQCETMIIAESEVFDALLLATDLEENLPRALNNTSCLLLQAELTIVIVAPGEDLTFTSQ